MSYIYTADTYVSYCNYLKKFNYGESCNFLHDFLYGKKSSDYYPFDNELAFVKPRRLLNNPLNYTTKLLWRDLILNASENRTKSFFKFSDFSGWWDRNLSLISELDFSNDENIRIGMFLQMQTQFDDQILASNLEDYIRLHLKLYSDKLIQDRLISVYGISHEELLDSGAEIMKYFHEMRGVGSESEIRSLLFKRGLTENSINSILKRIILDRNEFINSFKIDVNFFTHSFAVLNTFIDAYPIIQYHDRLYCPIPDFIIKRLTKGLYYDIMPEDGSNGGNITNLIGKQFENLVYEKISQLNLDDFLIFQGTDLEIRKGLPTPDIVLYDSKNNIAYFLETKIERIPNSLLYSGDNGNFEKLIKRLTKTINQLYKGAERAIKGDKIGTGYTYSKGDKLVLVYITPYFWAPKGKFNIGADNYATNLFESQMKSKLLIELNEVIDWYSMDIYDFIKVISSSSYNSN